MATQRKRAVKKATAKKKARGVKKTATPKKKVRGTKKTAAPKEKRRGTPRNPPMHAKVSHSELDDVDHEEVFEVFKAYDRDGSGSIDRGELARLLEALGSAPTEEELNVALDVIDSNHSGRISWAEFRAWWSDR